MRGPIFFLGICLSVAAAGYAQTTAPSSSGVDSPSYWLWHAAADANSLTDPVEKAGVLTTIAQQFNAVGDLQSASAVAAVATEAAGQITDASAKFRAFLALGSYHDQAQDNLAGSALTSAATAVSGMAAGPAKTAANQQITDLMGVVSGFDAASISLKSIGDPATRAARFTDLAAAFGQSSPRHRQDYLSAIAAADAAAGQMDDPVAGQMARAMIVRMCVQVGDLDEAAVMANSLSNPAAQGEADAYLAQGCAAEGRHDQSVAAIAQLIAAAGGSPDDRRAAIWLDIARARQALNDKDGALKAVDTAVQAADRLEPADQADALASAAGMQADLGDSAGAAVIAGDAAKAATNVSDPSDAAEIYMSVAAAQARCGLGDAAGQSISAARGAASKIPNEKRHPGGDPPMAAYLSVIQSAAAAGDFTTAQRIAKDVNDPHLNHDAALAIAQAEIDLGQYQAAEDAAAHEGSVDSEAAVCGMIASSLARTRTAIDADAWVRRLPNSSDRIAADLAVAQVEESKPVPATPAVPN